MTAVHTYFYIPKHVLYFESDSSVGIAIRYGLDGPGTESRWGRDFPHTSGPTLWPTKPAVKRVLALSRG